MVRRSTPVPETAPCAKRLGHEASSIDPGSLPSSQASCLQNEGNCMGREYEDDDGRTVADMSDLPDVSFLGRWSGLHGDKSGGRGSIFGFGRHSGGSSGGGNGSGGPYGGRNSIPAPEMDSDERRMYVLGMLKASLGIGMIYVIAFAAFVGLLLLLWR